MFEEVPNASTRFFHDAGRNPYFRAGIVSRLKARIRKVKRTLALWDPENFPDSFVGIKEVSRYANETRDVDGIEVRCPTSDMASRL